MKGYMPSGKDSMIRIFPFLCPFLCPMNVVIAMVGDDEIGGASAFFHIYTFLSSPNLVIIIQILKPSHTYG